MENIVTFKAVVKTGLRSVEAWLWIDEGYISFQHGARSFGGTGGTPHEMQSRNCMNYTAAGGEGTFSVGRSTGRYRACSGAEGIPIACCK